jgi:hypothetical protein
MAQKKRRQRRWRRECKTSIHPIHPIHPSPEVWTVESHFPNSFCLNLNKIIEYWILLQLFYLGSKFIFSKSKNIVKGYSSEYLAIFHLLKWIFQN